MFLEHQEEDMKSKGVQTVIGFAMIGHPWPKTLRGRSHDTGMTFMPERVHSIPLYFSVSVYMKNSHNTAPLITSRKNQNVIEHMRR